MADTKPAVPGQALLEVRVADVDVDAFTSLFEQLAAAAITFTTLHELQETDPRWLERFTFLDNATRSETGDPQVPRTVGVMRARLAELELDPEACFVALEGERWIGYTVLDTAHSAGERLRQSWTGVLPAYRRRGVGSALKALAVAFAREHGYALIHTAVRADNVASRAMNRRIGFRPV